MTVKKVPDLCLVVTDQPLPTRAEVKPVEPDRDLGLSLREASRGFIISLKASNRYSPAYLETLSRSLAFLAHHAEANGWPEVARITVGHIEEYLTALQTAPRYGEARFGTISQSYIASQYRRLKRFFNWLVERDHIDSNPLRLIPHPHIDEKVIATVTDQEIIDLLRLLDPAIARTPKERFRLIRNRAALLMLVDTPGRKAELGEITMDNVTDDASAVLVTGKGRKQRWMPLGHSAQAALWDYLSVRQSESPSLWVDNNGAGMWPDWLKSMLKRLGKRAGVANLHPHRFRHTYAVNALRAGMPERILQLAGGWKRIPDTYLRTLGAEDVARVHREISPADKLTSQKKSPRHGRGLGGGGRGVL